MAASDPKPCKCCGACPTCGRRPQPYGVYPYWPYWSYPGVMPQPIYPNYGIGFGTTSGGWQVSSGANQGMTQISSQGYGMASMSGAVN